MKYICIKSLNQYIQDWNRAHDNILKIYIYTDPMRFCSHIKFLLNKKSCQIYVVITDMFHDGGEDKWLGSFYTTIEFYQVCSTLVQAQWIKNMSLQLLLICNYICHDVNMRSAKLLLSNNETYWLLGMIFLVPNLNIEWPPANALWPYKGWEGAI